MNYIMKITNMSKTTRLKRKSNPSEQFCRLLPNRSVIQPYKILSDFHKGLRLKVNKKLIYMKKLYLHITNRTLANPYLFYTW